MQAKGHMECWNHQNIDTKSTHVERRRNKGLTLKEEETRDSRGKKKKQERRI